MFFQYWQLFHLFQAAELAEFTAKIALLEEAKKKKEEEATEWQHKVIICSSLSFTEHLFCTQHILNLQRLRYSHDLEGKRDHCVNVYILQFNINLVIKANKYFENTEVLVSLGMRQVLGTPTLKSLSWLLNDIQFGGRKDGD